MKEINNFNDFLEEVIKHVDEHYKPGISYYLVSITEAYDTLFYDDKNQWRKNLIKEKKLNKDAISILKENIFNNIVDSITHNYLKKIHGDKLNKYEGISAGPGCMGYHAPYDKETLEKMNKKMNKEKEEWKNKIEEEKRKLTKYSLAEKKLYFSVPYSLFSDLYLYYDIVLDEKYINLLVDGSK